MKRIYSILSAGFCAILLHLPTTARAQTEPFNNALHLNYASSQYVSVPSGIWFSNAFTVEAWVNPRSFPSWSRLIEFGDGPSDNNVLCALTQGPTGFPIFQWYNGATEVASLESPTPLTPNTWTHLAFTYDGTSGTMTILMNGVPTTTLSGIPQPVVVTRTTNYVGRSLYTADGYADANIDDLRIWNVARTPAQIKAAMGGPLTGGESGLVLYYRFDENSGTVVANSATATGAAENGTDFNGATNIASTAPFFPIVTTGAASALDASAAILNGTVNPGYTPTSGYIEYGQTLGYGSYTATNTLAATNVTLAVSDSISGLVPGGTYHFQLVVTNIFGTSLGGDSVFTTPVFSNVNTSLPGVFLGSVAWGDYDNDGLLDILISGSPGSGQLTQVWHNNGNGAFSNINAGLPGLYYSSVAWGDYDNDGLLDILISGDAASGELTQVWHNNGDGTFSNINAGLPGVYAGAVAWGDYDNDGLPDILLSGLTQSGPITQVWRNNGNGTFSNINAGLPGVYDSSVAWGDYDNDGLLDILISGSSGSNPLTQVWHNNGDGTFSNINAGLPGVYSGAVAWGDYDNDGRLDILVSGFNGTNPITEIWHNNGNGVFSNINANLPGLVDGSVAWGDYDNDGLLDILISGSTVANELTQVWRNNGNGTFSNVNMSIPGMENVSVAWGDYNNDGRLDFMIAGDDAGNPLTLLWRNQTTQTNTPPAAPSGLSASVSGNHLVFHWNPSTDLQTPAAGLTYNLRVGSSSGGSDIISPMAAGNGFRRVPQRGNAQAVLSKSLPVRLTNFYWSVQAVDAAYAGSPFAPESSLSLLPALAPVGATNVTPGDLNGDGVVDQAELAAVLAHLATNGTVDLPNLDLSLVNYFGAVDPVLMANVDGLGGTNVTFGIPNTPDPIFSVQYSTNLTDWQTLGPATLNYSFTDTNAPSLPYRYYRLIYP